MTTTLPQPTKRTRPATGPGPKPATKPGAKPGAKPAARPGPKPAARPRPAAKAPRTPFVLLIVGLLGGALISLLLLNTVLAEDAFRLNDLQRQNTQLLQREQALKVDVKKAEAPSALAARARQLGMRPGPETPQFADAQHPNIGAAARYGDPKPKAAHKKKHKHPQASATPQARNRAHAAKPRNGHKRHRSTPAPSASSDGAFAGDGR